jgi:hypothetical protein
MDYKELFEKYQALLVENNSLKEEIRSLKAQLGFIECQGVTFSKDFDSEPELKPEMPCSESENSGPLLNELMKNIDK